MTITNMGSYLLLESAQITDVIANPSDYEKLEITGDINCCTSGCGGTVNTVTFPNPFTTTSSLQLVAPGIKVFPPFFGLTEFTDGVYKLSVKFFREDEDTLFQENCIFVDITLKCKVAALLKNLIEESKSNNTEKISTIAHLLHYALFNGSGCACNCEEMCKVYAELISVLDSVNPQIFVDCGC